MREAQGLATHTCTTHMVSVRVLQAVRRGGGGYRFSECARVDHVQRLCFTCPLCLVRDVARVLRLYACISGLLFLMSFGRTMISGSQHG